MLTLLSAAVLSLPATPVPAGSLEGIWHCKAYSRVIEIADGRVVVYEVTGGKALQVDAFPVPAEGSTSFFQLARVGDELHMNTTESRNLHRFERLDALPPPLVEEGADPDDPRLNFDVFWRAVHENYGFFDRHDIDWKALADEARARITAETTEDELFEHMTRLLDLLQDGHSSIRAGSRGFGGGIDHPLGQRLMEFRTLIDRNYLLSDPEVSPSGVFHTAKLTDGIAYVRIPGMRAGSTEAELANAAELDDILARFADCDGLILDVRFNGGGWENLSRRIAGRFTETRRVAYRTQARLAGTDEFTELQDQVIEPEVDSPWTKPTVLLTSRSSGSAAEILTLCMRVIPHVTVVGEPTNGSLSTPLGRNLPNGWRVAFSNERYFTPEGNNHEKEGVPPDELVPMTLEDLEAETDAALERAIDVLYS